MSKIYFIIFVEFAFNCCNSPTETKSHRVSPIKQPTYSGHYRFKYWLNDTLKIISNDYDLRVIAGDTVKKKWHMEV